MGDNKELIEPVMIDVAEFSQALDFLLSSRGLIQSEIDDTLMGLSRPKHEFSEVPIVGDENSAVRDGDFEYLLIG